MISAIVLRVMKVVGVLPLIVLAVGMTASISAQTITGTLRGTVTDTNGQLVPGGDVTATNQGTGVSVNSKTTGDGIYVISNLPPGKYTLVVESHGFKKSEIKDVDVRLDQNTMNVALQPGAVSETVTVVSGAEEIINRDQSQISASFDTRKVQELPSNAAGDGLDTLALLIPGVVPGSQRSTNTNGEGLSVNGNRPRSNNFQIDGSDNNDLVIGGPSLFVTNQDQVQEFQVITNNFSAQYGRNQGAIINIVTRGGTNAFHGSAFEYFRDQKHLDSMTNQEKRGADPADPATLKPPALVSNVFGGSFGGPIVKNRAFFFGTFQGNYVNQEAILQSGSLGILKEELPRLGAAFPGNPVIDAIVNYSAFALPFGNPHPSSAQTGTVTTSCLSPTAGRVACGTAGAQGPFRIGGPFDAVNVGGTFFQAAFIERLVPLPSRTNEYSLRGDVRPSSRDSFYVRYLDQGGTATNNVAGTNGYTGDTPFKSRNLGGSYIRQFSSSIVNEARAGFQKLFVNFGGGCENSTPGCISDPKDVEKSQADISLTGLVGFANPSASLRYIGPGGTLGLGVPQGRTTTVYQFADNLTITRGRHSIVAGGEFKYTKSDNPFLPSYQGAFTYNSVTRVLNNAPSAFSLSVGQFTTTLDQYDQYYFVQDDWKVRTNLTLNLGVRYEYYGAPINDLNDLTVARESGPNPLFNPALPLSARVVPRVPPDKNNLAPRFGFAYTPRFEKGFLHRLLGTDATVFRGGYAIAYETPFYNILTNVAGGAPVVASLTIATGSLPATGSPIPMPLGFGGDTVRSQAASTGLLPVGKLDPRLLTQTTVAPDFYSPYSQQWSFGMQRQLDRNNVFEVRYVGNHGVGLFQNLQPNPVIRNRALGFTATVPGFGPLAFPAFPNLVPAGISPVTCTDIVGTPDVESACNRRVVAGLGAITERANTAQSVYHSLQTRYNGRFLKDNLMLGAAFTWSKTLDNASEVFTFSEGSSNAQDPFNVGRAERSYSALDRPAAFSTNFIYTLPYYRAQRGFVGHLLGGFQVNGTWVITSGRRWTPGQTFPGSLLGTALDYEPTTGSVLRPFIGNSNADPRLVAISQVDAAMVGFGSPVTNVNGFWSFNELNNGNLVSVSPNDVRFIFNGPGSARIFGTPIGTTPRNYMQGPALNQMNLGFFKTTNISEKVQIQFRAELYNALNHPNPGYGITNSSANANTIGQILVETAGSSGNAFAEKADIILNRRVVQFGLRLVF